MNKKNNSNKNNGWKRIAAGALSMALVAGALPANVGGFLTGGKAIVANAGDTEHSVQDLSALYEEVYNWFTDGSSDFINSFKLCCLNEDAYTELYDCYDDVSSYLYDTENSDDTNKFYDALSDAYNNAKDIVEKGADTFATLDLVDISTLNGGETIAAGAILYQSVSSSSTSCYVNGWEYYLRNDGYKLFIYKATENLTCVEANNGDFYFETEEFSNTTETVDASTLQVGDIIPAGTKIQFDDYICAGPWADLGECMLTTDAYVCMIDDGDVYIAPIGGAYEFESVDAEGNYVSNNKGKDYTVAFSEFELNCTDTEEIEWTVTSENNCDYLFILVDDELEIFESGEESDYLEISPGEHKIVAVYMKDRSVANGSDCATIKNAKLKPLNAEVEPIPAAISYKTWNDENKELVDAEPCTEYTVVDSTSTSWGDGNTYVVNSNVEIEDRIQVNGTVNLILCDGAKLTASKGIEVREGNTLNIFGQTEGSGQLIANGGRHASGIGGDEGFSGGNVTVNGGTVTATGGDLASGIGGGTEGSGGNVTVNGGTVTAKGGEDGSGIGGGYHGAGGNVTVNGGTVTATGGRLASGIGGGYEGSGGTVTINGGTVTTNGSYYASGIGGGYSGSGGTVTINGGTVTANGGDRASGIGGGLGSSENGILTLGAGVALETSTDNENWAEATNTPQIKRFMRTSTQSAATYVVSASENLAYTGDEKELVTVTGNGGTIHYKLDDGEWSENIPTAKNAGDYKVYWYSEESATYNASGSQEEPNEVEVSIAKIDSEIEVNAIEDLEYSGEDKALVEADGEGGTVYYRLGEEGQFTDAIPTAKDAGDYKVYWYAAASTNYNADGSEDEPNEVEVSIAKAAPDFTAPEAVEDLVFTGESQALVEAGTVTKGGDMEYAILTRAQAIALTNANQNIPAALNAYAALEWSSEGVPEVTDAGEYYVIYHVAENDNYNAAPSISTVPTNEEIEALIATIIPVDIEAGTALVTVEDGAVIADQEAVEDVYELKCGNTYTIYSNKTLDTNTILGLDISVSTNKTYNGTTYNYKYTVEFDNTIPDGTEIEFAHKHAAKAFNIDETHTDTDKVWVYCEGEPSENANCIARLNADGIYYYGTAPTEADVIIDECFGATAEIANIDEDFYFTLKGDTSASRLTATDLIVNKTYIVNAIVSVTIDGKVSRIAITQEIVFKAKPLADCDFYLKSGDTLTPLTVTNGEITVPSTKFTYNAQEQAPEIVVKNDILGTEITLTSTDYTDGIEPETNAGYYTSTLTAATGDEAKYSGNVKVNWSIAKANVSDYIAVAPINNVDTDDELGNDAIVYDGQRLDESDFEITAIEVSEDDSDAVKEKKALAQQLIDEIAEEYTSFALIGKEGFDLKTAGEQEGTVKLVNSNFFDVEKDVTPVIAKRAVTITPTANQKNTFGDSAAPTLTYTVEEQNDNANTGFIASDLISGQTANDFFGVAVKVGKEIETTNILNPEFDDEFDYFDFNNDAGTYGYTIIADALDNYDPILSEGAFFTVEPKSFTAADIYVTLDETVFDYDGSTKYVNVVSVMDGETELTQETPELTAKYYSVGGTTQKILPGEFKVQVEGEGNYKDIAYASWVINPKSGNPTINYVGEGQKAYDGIDISGMFTVDTGAIPQNKATIEIEYYDADENKLPEAPKNAGTYTVKATVSATGYNTQSTEKDIIVTPLDVTVTAELETNTIIYSDPTPEVASVYYDGILDDEKADFEANSTVEWILDDDNDQYTGEVNTTDEYANNYNFTVTPVSFTVEPKDIDSTDIRVYYTDKTKLAATGGWVTCNDITVVDVKKGKTLTEGVDYTLNGNTSKVTGTFTIEIVGMNHYYGVNEIYWTVVDTDEEAASAKILDYNVYDDAGRINFTVHNVYKGSKEAKYGVLIYRGDEAIGDMTLEAAAADIEILNQEYTNKTVSFRAKDIGDGVYARPYIIVDGKVNYGNQVYVKYAELKEQEAIASAHSEILNVAKYDDEGRISFIANYYYKGDKTPKYGVLIYRGNDEIGALTVDAAKDNSDIVDQACASNKVTFRSKDLGNGVCVRTYMIVDDKVIYGAQRVYNASDYS